MVLFKRTVAIVFFFIAMFCYSEPKELNIFRKAYPDIDFIASYSMKYKDWLIEMKIPITPDSSEKKTAQLYWADGKFLPEKELDKTEKYWTLLYSYPKELKDPANFTKEEAQRMREFGSTDNRKNGAGTPMFFFEAIYDADTRASLEQHIHRYYVLNHNVSVHERIKAPLLKVEKHILDEAKKNVAVKSFVDEISSEGGYVWRIINGTNRKSFHSIGVAIDIQPKTLHGKEIFWSWTKDKNPENWMLTPLNRRWMPPQKVIDIFEKEGFIWGGKWGVWDNMHFEYHPELILYNYGSF